MLGEKHFYARQQADSPSLGGGVELSERTIQGRIEAGKFAYEIAQIEYARDRAGVELGFDKAFERYFSTLQEFLVDRQILFSTERFVGSDGQPIEGGRAVNRRAEVIAVLRDETEGARPQTVFTIGLLGGEADGIVLRINEGQLPGD